MKISIALSLLILAVAAIFGWNNHQRILVITETHRSLAEEAAALGLSIDLQNPDGAPRLTKRARDDKEARARLAAKKIVAFVLEIEELQESGEFEGEAMRARTAEFMDLMLSLDAAHLKILISELRASTEMKDDTRSGMIIFAIMTLANDHPEAALTLFTESDGMIDNEMMGTHLLSSSLANWASKDPDAALAWVRKNGKKYPDLITDEVKAGLVKGAASNGIALGFDLLGELELEDPDEAISALAGAVGSHEERTEFLKLFRAHRKADPNASGPISADVMHVLAEGIVKGGFEEGSRWVAENDLSKEEIGTMARRIESYAKSSEKGQWIVWIGENLSGEDRDRQIEAMMRSWTRNDYRAAGEWLAAAPEGPAKKASVSSYAKTVAPHDPQTAAQWALTLPPGESRKETLTAVYESWPQDDPASKAERDAFMATHPAE